MQHNRYSSGGLCVTLNEVSCKDLRLHFIRLVQRDFKDNNAMWFTFLILCGLYYLCSEAHTVPVV